MLLFTLSSIGLPGLNGFAGEFLILSGMFQRAWVGAPAGLAGQFLLIAVLSVFGVVLGAWTPGDGHTDPSSTTQALAAGKLVILEIDVQGALQLKALGVDLVLAYPTDEHILGLSAEKFFQDVVVGALDAKALVEGPNFYFGHNREGDVQLLEKLAACANMTLDVVEPLAIGDDEQGLAGTRNHDGNDRHLRLEGDFREAFAATENHFVPMKKALHRVEVATGHDQHVVAF